MRVAVMCGLMGLMTLVWVFARSVTIIEVFKAQEFEHEKYYQGLKAECSMVKEQNGGGESPSMVDVVRFSKINDRMVMGITLKHVQETQACYFLLGTLGLLMLGGAAFGLGRKRIN